MKINNKFDLGQYVIHKATGIPGMIISITTRLYEDDIYLMWCESRGINIEVTEKGIKALPSE